MKLFIISICCILIKINIINALTCDEALDCVNKIQKCVDTHFGESQESKKKLDSCFLKSTIDCYAAESNNNYYSGVSCLQNSQFDDLKAIASCIDFECYTFEDMALLELEGDYEVNAVFNNVIGTLNKFEGYRLDMYVPVDNNGKVFGQSGPTIATGIDLGQRSVSEIKNMKISESLKTKLFLYAGKKGEAAKGFVSQHPLRISDSEAMELNRAVISPFIEKLINTYNSSSKVSFTNLPVQAQQVIASVGHQFGHLPRAAPSFWKYATTQNWEKVKFELLNWNGVGKSDPYISRRRGEASILSGI